MTMLKGSYRSLTRDMTLSSKVGSGCTASPVRMVHYAIYTGASGVDVLKLRLASSFSSNDSI